MRYLYIKRSLVLSYLIAVLLLSAACSDIPLASAPPTPQTTSQTRIGWPFDTTAGHWEIENGYNWNTSNGGLDHGCSTTGSTCYEQYSFDFQMAGPPGSTTGVNVLSPASGALVDFGSAVPGDGTSGCCASISIAGYSGYHVLVCHLENPAQSRVVTRGEVIGQVAGGQYGDHIHMTFYYLQQGISDTSANASKRHAFSFTLPWSIAGCSYPSDGSVDQWANTPVPCDGSSTTVPLATSTPTSTPAPVPSFASGTWQGQGTYSNGSQGPFDMKLVVTVQGDSFTGTLEEDVYSSIVAVQGSVSVSGGATEIVFIDTSAVSGSGIQLNCTYLATVTSRHMQGTWHYQGDSSSDGAIMLDWKGS